MMLDQPRTSNKLDPWRTPNPNGPVPRNRHPLIVVAVPDNPLFISPLATARPEIASTVAASSTTTSILTERVFSTTPRPRRSLTEIRLEQEAAAAQVRSTYRPRRTLAQAEADLDFFNAVKAFQATVPDFSSAPVVD